VIGTRVVPPLALIKYNDGGTTILTGSGRMGGVGGQRSQSVKSPWQVVGSSSANRPRLVPRTAQPDEYEDDAALCRYTRGCSVAVAMTALLLLLCRRLATICFHQT
jgi:hypothetical protein